MPPDRLNFANLIPSEKGVPNPNIPKKEKRPPKAKAYELIRLEILEFHVILQSDEMDVFFAFIAMHLL